jgi:hypothetical protein
MIGSSYRTQLVYKNSIVAMCVQILRCLKLKYLLFFSARWVFRHAGMDVTIAVKFRVCCHLSNA